MVAQSVNKRGSGIKRQLIVNAVNMKFNYLGHFLFILLDCEHKAVAYGKADKLAAVVGGSADVAYRRAIPRLRC